MNRALNGTRRRLLPVLTVLGTLGCHTAAISQTSGQVGEVGEFPVPTERFDLVIYGSGFDPGEHEVFLLTNLDEGAEWVSLGHIEPVAHQGAAGDDWSAVVFPDIDTARFLGQDFRESYLDLKIATRDGSDGSRVSAIYAMPHVDGAGDAAPRIARLIETEPVLVEHHSLASHVQPAPQTLGPGSEYMQHVRAPMKHTLPGVAEVEQLQVEWRNRGH